MVLPIGRPRRTFEMISGRQWPLTTVACSLLCGTKPSLFQIWTWEGKKGKVEGATSIVGRLNLCFILFLNMFWVCVHVAA